MSDSDENFSHECTFSSVPSVLYREEDGLHGNFLAASYRRIRACPEWSRRLNKHYAAYKKLARPEDRIRHELDCANSSDALLMNIFCYPGVTHRKQLCALLGVGPGERPQFGIKPRLALTNDRSDRTEIDMVVGHLLVEAKLTESNFQSVRPELVLRYQGLDAAFEVTELPRSDGRFLFYQLIRGVMAAFQHGKSFLVIIDARRFDLAKGCYRIVCAVRSSELRSRCAILTWQELGSALPPKLQSFLADKYGIHPKCSYTPGLAPVQNDWSVR